MAEADMCVLATLLAAIDFGYRTILVEDAISSTSDEAYENILKLFTTRYSHHVELVFRGGGPGLLALTPGAYQVEHAGSSGVVESSMFQRRLCDDER
jgi:hypothetical protein